MSRIIQTAIGTLAMLLWATCTSLAAPGFRDDSTVPAPRAIPRWGALHNVGGFSLGITNGGAISMDNYYTIVDYFTNESIQGCEYPIGSHTKYVWLGGLWIGGIVGTDTLVSTSGEEWTGGNEFQPVTLEPPIIYHSTISKRADQRQNAVSHQDFSVTFADTCTDCHAIPRDEYRYHIPMGIKIEQTSHAWSYLHARDIVIFEENLHCIGSRPITNGYVGIYFDDDVIGMSGQTDGYYDDLTGFRRYHPSASGCGIDTITVAWLADNDGNLRKTATSGEPVPNVTGTVLLDLAQVGQFCGYNWWLSNFDPRKDYGPRSISRPSDPYRLFSHGNEGTPNSDEDKYYVLRHHEIDFDQAYASHVDPADSVWAYPPETIPIDDYADGYDSRFLVSFGPFNLEPGDSVRFAWAFVGGRAFHVDPDNGAHLPGDPWTYNAALNFSDLSRNAEMATWVYDNPGFDTDGDGYAGKFRICEGETSWYAGDGVPDLVADVSPSAPTVSVQIVDSDLVIRWNGAASEMSVDRVSRLDDFEGYSVYLKGGAMSDSLRQVAEWDVPDYFRYFNEGLQRTWDCDRTTYTETQLKRLYAPGGAEDSLWSPQQFTRQHLFASADTSMYFVPVNCNASKFGVETPIVKRFPDARRPNYRAPDKVPAESLTVYLDEGGNFKYYDYELKLDSLARGQYQVAVTAFDRGSPLGGLTILESPRSRIFVGNENGAGCCVGSRGNVDCDSEGSVDIGDVTALIDNLFLTGRGLCCVKSANVDESPDGAVDIGDVSALIDALYVLYQPLGTCVKESNESVR